MYPSKRCFCCETTTYLQAEKRPKLKGRRSSSTEGISVSHGVLRGRFYPNVGPLIPACSVLLQSDRRSPLAICPNYRSFLLLMDALTLDSSIHPLTSLFVMRFVYDMWRIRLRHQFSKTSSFFSTESVIVQTFAPYRETGRM